MESVAAVLEVIRPTLPSVGLCILSAFVGYLFHAAKTFREQKQEAYKDILLPIVQMVYDRENANDADYNRALLRLWLYGTKRVTRVLDRLFIIHGSQKGDKVQALQEIVVAMRSDIQLLPWQRLKPQDIHHLYTRISK
jgi:hypothetical protein